MTTVPLVFRFFVRVSFGSGETPRGTKVPLKLLLWVETKIFSLRTYALFQHQIGQF